MSFIRISSIDMATPQEREEGVGWPRSILILYHVLIELNIYDYKLFN